MTVKPKTDETTEDHNEKLGSDGANQGARSANGDAMVTASPAMTSAPTISDVHGAISTSKGGDQTSGEMLAEQAALEATDAGAAVQHDEDGRPVGDVKDFDGGKKAAKLESRDERHDSIDPQSGALTEEATALRRERDDAERDDAERAKDAKHKD